MLVITHLRNRYLMQLTRSHQYLAIVDDVDNSPYLLRYDASAMLLLTPLLEQVAGTSGSRSSATAGHPDEHKDS